MHSDTWTTDYTSTKSISAPSKAITEILLNAPALPLWNPALSSVSQPSPDGSYPVIFHGILRGRLNYLTKPGEIIMFIDTPGLKELSSWIISPSEKEKYTIVTHRIRQRGFLTSLIPDQEAKIVPKKRLIRLAQIISP